MIKLEKENLDYRLALYSECDYNCSDVEQCYDCAETIDLANAW